ncbi:6077_t:CDS:2, partial [Entrophospora sp. SA101]
MLPSQWVQKYGCVKLTYSDYGYCDPHAQKHRRREYNHQKKLEKMAQNGVTVEQDTS